MTGVVELFPAGWPNLPLLRYKIRTNRWNNLWLTHLDTLSGCKNIRLCTHYTEDGTIFRETNQELGNLTAEYEDHVGWSGSVSHVRDFKDLDVCAQTYVKRIEFLAGVPITRIFVGKEYGPEIVR